MIDPESGLDKFEKECMDGLMKAYSAFLKMDRQHPDEMRDFINPLHRMQELLAIRVIRREFPKFWPTYNVDKELPLEINDGVVGD